MHRAYQSVTSSADVSRRLGKREMPDRHSGSRCRTWSRTCRDLAHDLCRSGGGTFEKTVGGDNVVTADAGMSCELMDARVTNGACAKVDIPCDSGIR